MVKLHQKLTSTPCANVLADIITEAANSVRTTAPVGNCVFGGNGIRVYAGVSIYGHAWLEITSNVISSLCENWFSDKPIDTDFQEEVRKRLNEREQSTSIRNVEIVRDTWAIKLTVSYLEK